MDAEASDSRIARVAGAIAEPARARILCHLLDGRARTATELAAVAGVGAPTASVHLARLREQQLVEALAQGRHRYFRLAGPEVAALLESLLVLAHGPSPAFAPSTPHRLRAARTCYDHLAGELGVTLHAHFMARGWLVREADELAVTPAGEVAFSAWGVDVQAARARRRRFACACIDWSERREHLAGSLGAALLQALQARGWVLQDLDSRALALTAKGAAALKAAGMALPALPTGR
ncbi:MAG: ArsR/SmtB family transcription factor [Rhizobacter sp.]|jgi:DNA-binding transcriptional ArsR family regulator